MLGEKETSSMGRTVDLSFIHCAEMRCNPTSKFGNFEACTINYGSLRCISCEAMVNIPKNASAKCKLTNIVFICYNKAERGQRD